MSLREPPYDYVHFRPSDLPDGTCWQCRVLAVQRTPRVAMLAVNPLGRAEAILLLEEPDRTLPEQGDRGWITFRHFERPRGRRQAHWIYSKDKPQ